MRQFRSFGLFIATLITSGYLRGLLQAHFPHFHHTTQCQITKLLALRKQSRTGLSTQPMRNPSKTSKGNTLFVVWLSDVCASTLAKRRKYLANVGSKQNDPWIQVSTVVLIVPYVVQRCYDSSFQPRVLRVRVATAAGVKLPENGRVKEGNACLLRPRCWTRLRALIRSEDRSVDSALTGR